MRERAILVVAGALVAVLLGACAEGEKHERGWDYLPDMYDSPAYRSYQSERVTVRETDKDGKSADVHHEVPMMLTPPEGTVQRDFVPYAIAPLDFDAARANPNPLSPTAAVLREGQANFAIFCVVCHGNDGNAVNGYVAASQAHPNYFSGIKSLNTANVAAMPDGEIYHIITLGTGKMPNYRAQLMPETRWAVVLYVKALSRASVTAESAAEDLKTAQAAATKDPSADNKLALEKATRVAGETQRTRDLILAGGDAATFAPTPAAVPEYVKPAWPEH